MNGNELLDKMGLIDPAFIEEADAPQVKKAVALKRWLAAAACLVLLFSLGFGTYAYAVEAKEYQEALEFFEEHDLTTENLSRTDIKEVYNDIATESFTNSFSANVILNSLTPEQAKAYENRFNQQPSLGNVKEIWTYVFKNAEPTAGYSPIDEDFRYLVVDSMELKGKKYVSVDAIEGEKCNYPQINEEDISRRWSGKHTAMLLVEDPDTKEWQVIYKMPGARAGELSNTPKANLVWNVETSAKIVYSPGTSSFRYYIVCDLVQYTFDDSGTLVDTAKTSQVIHKF